MPRSILCVRPPSFRKCLRSHLRRLPLLVGNEAMRDPVAHARQCQRHAVRKRSKIGDPDFQDRGGRGFCGGLLRRGLSSGSPCRPAGLWLGRRGDLFDECATLKRRRLPNMDCVRIGGGHGCGKPSGQGNDCRPEARFCQESVNAYSRHEFPHVNRRF